MDEALRPPAAPAGPIHGTVLCVEDNPISMILVEEMLAMIPGITLLKATSGREGARMALAEKPDLILLDMHLPDIGGLEVVRILNEELSEQRLCAILVTADTLSMDVVKAMSLGASEYWLKPLTVQQLQRDLPHALRRAQAARAKSAQR